ncbi:hypothetical protein OP10G_0107 [Fimbriimonas ginsengisoli Gsoil 348]|uniref:Uncharacterized protein n=1 Tax=Fimbriimonas ginsengisoli Gsoil 348 TaxID=661478 RepID=A0A068NL24_FIMGI|nr:hypothetical protein OP10G_0107 [Fimbriimonas ginsengisoli Gsoil 348]
MLIAAALPEIFRRCKPLAKTIADTLIKAGETVQRMAETDEPKAATVADAPVADDLTVVDAIVVEPGTGTAAEAPNPDVKEDTTKVGAGTKEVDLNTASPTGHEEIASQIAAEAKGDGAASEPVSPRPRKARKPLEPDQPRNPKRTKNSSAG